jgi:long-chain acyl-CoA synthetase
MKLGDLVRTSALRYPDREAVVCAGTRISFAKLDHRSNRLANGLLGLGQQPGDRVALYLPNSIELVVAMAALAKSGGVMVPLSTRLAPPEVAYMLSHSEPMAVIFSPELRDVARQAAAGLAGVRLIVTAHAGPGETALEDLMEAGADTAPPALPAGFDDLAICYTSGTTGRPKGAVSTHRNMILGQGYMNAMEFRLRAEDRTLITTPMAHRTGLARLVNAVFLGSTMVVQPRFDPAEAVALIETEAITVIGVVPTVARLLLPEMARRAGACRTLRTMLATGEVFPPALKRQLFEALPGLGLHSFYSATEAGLVASLRPEEQAGWPDSMGRAVPGVEVRLVDEHLADVAAGEAGEILVRCGGPGEVTLMREYFRDPAATEAAFVGGWLRTGDMARREPDGHLTFVDRLTDMIVSGGYNIYSREAVMAFVTLAPGAGAGAEEIIAHCRQHIAGYKKPRYLRILDGLPLNSTGKVAKAELRRMAREDMAAGLG